MKKAIRNNVFETNSSAVHSLAVHSEGLTGSNLPVDSDGYIIADFGNYGDYNMGITIYGQAEKLAYLATESYYLYGWDTDIEEYNNWNMICKAICKHAHAAGIRLQHKVEPELNHQEVPNYTYHFIDPWDECSIIDFVFNKYIGVRMSHD